MNLALLFLCCMSHAAIDAPQPKHEHRFYDRPAKIELATAFTASGLDSAITCHNLGSPHEREFFLPTQSCAGVTAILTADVIAQELFAYLLHRTSHHKLERGVRFITIGSNLTGAAKSIKHGAF